ncbi:hypothetical protein PT273_02115 [Orbaceae bacterium ESL0727]|nr:hypothetical protein [Orbaceae bacterium ESL0727]
MKKNKESARKTQKHKNTKTQKHKNTKTQKHKNTKTQLLEPLIDGLAAQFLVTLRRFYSPLSASFLLLFCTLYRLLCCLFYRRPSLLYALYSLHRQSHPHRQRLSAATILITSLTMSCAFNVNALSASTANAIQGTPPYLTFDGGVTKAYDTATLLGIKLSDGRDFNQSNNPSSINNPIELPVAGQSVDDIEMFIPKQKVSVTLDELIRAPNSYWRDDNEDGQGTNGITATGTLTAQIQDSSGNTVARSDSLTPCEKYYKITLSSSGGRLTTQYGYPNSTNFNAVSTTYYVKSKMPDTTTVCYAQPNMRYSSVNKDFWHDKIDGPASQWDPVYGFKPQNIHSPLANFPTTGGSGLFFYLLMTGPKINWQNIRYDKSPSDSGISLAIGDGKGNNQVKITLTGPVKQNNSSNNINYYNSAVPTTFTLYTDATKQKKLYSFTIGKWFLYEGGYSDIPYRENQCSNNLSSRYRIISPIDVTNANGRGWTGGLPGQPNNYQRRIGGGLFSEWGNMYDYWIQGASIVISSGYFTLGNKYAISSSDGFFNGVTPSAYLCVTP